LGRLIILPALKPSCGIHARTLLLPPGQRLSKANVLGNLPGGVELPPVNSSFCRS
jgi:hypothetical protein